MLQATLETTSKLEAQDTHRNNQAPPQPEPPRSRSKQSSTGNTETRTKIFPIETDEESEPIAYTFLHFLRARLARTSKFLSTLWMEYLLRIIRRRGAAEVEIVDGIDGNAARGGNSSGEP